MGLFILKSMCDMNPNHWPAKVAPMDPVSDEVSHEMQLGQDSGFAKGLHVGPQCSEAYRSADGIVGNIQRSSRRVVPI